MTTTVVIPTHNRAELLRRTLASVRRVQEQSALEVVVVDDGSTDDTARVVANSGTGAHHVHQVRQGLAKARNRGLDAVRGRYSFFLDSDDLVTADKLIRQVTFLEARPDLAASYTRWSYIDAADEVLVEADGSDRTKDLRAALSLSNFAPIHAYLFRTAALRAVGGFAEDLDGHGYEDWDLLGRLVASGAQFGFQPFVTAAYRMHAGNMCSIDADAMWRCGRDVVARLRRLGFLGTSLARAEALVPMEACCQFWRRGDVKNAYRLGTESLRAWEGMLVDEMFFHYLATVPAPAELGHAAFSLFRRPERDRIFARYSDVWEEWVPATGRAPVVERADAFRRLEQWIVADEPC